MTSKTTKQFYKWLNENYIIKPTQKQEVYSILYSNLKLKNDITHIITYFNHFKIETKLKLETMRIKKELGLKIYVLSQNNIKPIREYITYFKQSLQSKENIKFKVLQLSTEQYNNKRIRSHKIEN